MNNTIQKFNFNNLQVRTVILNNEPWFVAGDVTHVLELSNTSSAVSKLEDDERSKFNLGRQGNVNIVNEYGLYSLILTSRKPSAKKFQRWVTHEVLPQIRTTGSYGLPNTHQPDITAQEVHLLKLKEKAFDKAVEKIAFENSCYTMTQAAEELGMSVKQFTTLLEDNGLIYRGENSKIMATDPNSKLFYLRKFHESKNSAIVQTKVTPFGLENFRLMFVSDSLNLLDLLEG